MSMQLSKCAGCQCAGCNIEECEVPCIAGIGCDNTVTNCALFERLEKRAYDAACDRAGE